MNSTDRLNAYLEYANAARRRAGEATCDITRRRQIALARSWDVLVAQEREIQSWPHGVPESRAHETRAHLKAVPAPAKESGV